MLYLNIASLEMIKVNAVIFFITCLCGVVVVCKTLNSAPGFNFSQRLSLLYRFALLSVQA